MIANFVAGFKLVTSHLPFLLGILAAVGVVDLAGAVLLIGVVALLLLALKPANVR